jgi:hypothetical protein
MVYEVKTKLNCEKVFDKAEKFFNINLGLESSKEENCRSYVGGGGHVKLSCCKKDEKTVVEIQTREWDRVVKKFLKEIK